MYCRGYNRGEVTDLVEIGWLHSLVEVNRERVCRAELITSFAKKLITDCV